MKQNRQSITLVAVLSFLMSVILLWGSYSTAAATVTGVFARHSARLMQAGQAPLGVMDIIRPRVIHGQMWPTTSAPTGERPCGTDCMAQGALTQASVGPASIPLPWSAGAGAGLLVLGLLCSRVALSPNPRVNLINYQRDRVRLTGQTDSLPIVQDGRARWGIMQRTLTGGGRREFGNGVFIGAPGRGKSSLLKSWLVRGDDLNFVVLDLKGELWRTTAGHRATVGRVIRFDLTSMAGDAVDPLDTDDRGVAQAIIEIFLPSSTGGKSDYFNKSATEIALAYWAAARQTGQSAVSVLVRAATSPTQGMLKLARALITLAPETAREDLQRAFETAFGSVWDDPAAAAGGERGSVLQSFKSGFAGLNTPEILSTLSRTTFSPADLVEQRATVYISAPSTEPPYKGALEVLMGAVIQSVSRYVDQDREGVQGQTIVLLADEAGILRVPQFTEILAAGRSRGLSLMAFVQSMGQLDQYHTRGWRGIVDTIHHWTWWNTNDPDAHAFLRGRCGVYDRPSESHDGEERRRRPYVEVHAYDEISPSWAETSVLTLLDLDRTYPIFGQAVNPYSDKIARQRMETPPPQLPVQQQPAAPVPTTSAVTTLEEYDGDEIF